MSRDEKRIIIFDGLCNLCDYSVRFIINKDTRAKFSFTSCQSAEGKKLQSLHGVDTIEDGTVIYVRNGSVYIKSDAALEIAKDLEGVWKHLYLFRFIPRPIRDYFYSVISRNRYRWFGRKSECLIPDEKIKQRFL